MSHSISTSYHPRLDRPLHWGAWSGAQVSHPSISACFIQHKFPSQRSGFPIRDISSSTGCKSPNTSDFNVLRLFMCKCSSSRFLRLDNPLRWICSILLSWIFSSINDSSPSQYSFLISEKPFSYRYNFSNFNWLKTPSGIVSIRFVPKLSSLNESSPLKIPASRDRMLLSYKNKCLSLDSLLKQSIGMLSMPFEP